MDLGYILLENLALSAALDGGDWSLPLANLQDPQIVSNPARCSDASNLANSQFRLTWSSPVYMTDLVLCGHSMGLDDKIQVTFSADSEQLLQIEWEEVYGRIYETGDLPWEQENWYTGKPRLSDIEGYTRHRRVRLPQSLAVDEILVEIDARENEDDLDIGYVMVASPLAPAWPYTWGREVGYNARTQTEVTAGGRKIKARRVAARTHTVTFPSLTKAEAFRLYDVAIKDSIHPAIFVPDPADAINEFREVFPADMTITGKPRQSNELEDWSVTLNFEEMQG